MWTTLWQYRTYTGLLSNAQACLSSLSTTISDFSLSVVTHVGVLHNIDEPNFHLFLPTWGSRLPNQLSLPLLWWPSFSIIFIPPASQMSLITYSVHFAFGWNAICTFLPLLLFMSACFLLLSEYLQILLVCKNQASSWEQAGKILRITGLRLQLLKNWESTGYSSGHQRDMWFSSRTKW